MTDKSRKAVPREPTEAMLAVGDTLNPPFGPPEDLTEEYCAKWKARTRKSWAHIWRAMFDAAPVLATAPAEPPKDGERDRLLMRLGLIKDWLLHGGKDTKEAIAGDIDDVIALLARLSAPVPELTERERGVLRHALTGGRDVTPYRNHFAADEGHADMPTLRALVARGLMIERKNKSPITPDTLFHCTEAGAKAVGLHLPNDSRGAVPAREWVPAKDKGAAVDNDNARYPLAQAALQACPAIASMERAHKVVEAILRVYLTPPPAADK